MSEKQFIDYYEVLQVSPNADAETIDRIFRHLAKRYHPDNQETGNRERFEQIEEAHRTLMNSEKRAAYDVRHQYAQQFQWQLGKDVKEVIDSDGFEGDQMVRARILSVLYVQCRRQVDNPGLGSVVLEKLLGYPSEHLAFHVWYLRQKGLIEHTEGGLLAITAEGVDQVMANGPLLRRDRLLTARAIPTKSDGNKLKYPYTS